MGAEKYVLNIIFGRFKTGSVAVRMSLRTVRSNMLLMVKIIITEHYSDGSNTTNSYPLK